MSSKLQNILDKYNFFRFVAVYILYKLFYMFAASLGNAEEDKVSVVSDVESVITHYCKLRHMQYTAARRWTDIIVPLLAAEMNPTMLYSCFDEILEKYIPRSVHALIKSWRSIYSDSIFIFIQGKAT